MKLHAFGAGRLMPKAHNFVLLCPGSDLEIVTQGAALHHERMVARRFEWVRKPLKNTTVIVMHGGRLAVHEAISANDTTTIGLGQ